MAILVLNSGSSSLKLALVEPTKGDRSYQGVAERIGEEGAVLRTKLGGRERTEHPSLANHEDALRAALERLEQAGLHHDVQGVGHRVVHGGEAFADSATIDDRVVAAIESAARLAPLHNPANLLGIRAARAAFPGVPHVAVFDTAFHQTMPPRAFRYAVPEAWYREHGARKYGFHGTSHRYVAEEAARRIGRPLRELQILTAHLGNGSSACAVKHAQSVDTTMGLTPLAGLVMGTRSGDVDPALVGYMATALGTDAASIVDDLNERSGLLGLSGRSNDMRNLLEAREKGDSAARLAVDVFCHRLASWLLALSASLDRVDAVVFTGGIGEHAAPIRAEVTARLWPLAIRIDADANARHGAPSGALGLPGSTPVWVIPTDEELMIARDTQRLTGSR
jgi:acetate kinase